MSTAHRRAPVRSRAPRTGRRYPAVAVAAVAAAVLGLIGTHVTAPADPGAGGAVRRIEQDPPPPLFPDAELRGWTTRLDAQQRAADALYARWRSGHGTARDDPAFVRWAADQMPDPPAEAARAAGLGEVRRLARTRTAAGRTAAAWLAAHGERDIWRLYLDDRRELMPRAEGEAARVRLDAALELAGTISGGLAGHYRRSRPSALDPALGPARKATPAADCACAYPAAPAALSSAAVAVLTAWAPRRAAEYRWMQVQVMHARLYTADHLRDDLLAGALLGALVGDYIRAADTTPTNRA
ncbi:hypothetical protein PV341_35395 [Streptomyces sp. PA03-1a]|nr:hypothetical protein [Streptomyces sp. PA03-1a]MDX2816509.1 hypothetical protein [Streptomyces sp. PA03-5A]